MLSPARLGASLTQIDGDHPKRQTEHRLRPASIRKGDVDSADDLSKALDPVLT
jgi:hypothetical protein